MLNICDVDIFDQNLSSADFDIDTQWNIILFELILFDISKYIDTQCDIIL